MNYFICTSHHFTPHGRYELNKLASLPMCGFIAQLVEHRTSIAEVTGSNPVEALIFFRLLLSNCLNWKIYCYDHSSLWSTTAVQIYELFHTCIYFTSLRWYCCYILLMYSAYINITSSNQRLWECVRCRINVYPNTLNDFPSWLSTSKNQPFFINNRGFAERYFSDKVHASLIDWWLRCVTAPVSVDSHV